MNFFRGFIIGLVLITIYLMLSGCTSASRLPDNIRNTEQLSETKYSPIIRLHNSTGHKEFFCSGVVISKNYAATAAHCAVDYEENNKKILVFDELGRNTGLKVSVAGVDQQMDIALLTGDFEGFNSGVLNPSPYVITYNILSTFQEQTPLRMCGFPNGGDKFCSDLYVKGTYYFGALGSGFLYPGMSGGPVFNPNTGLIVGVNSGVVDGAAIVAPLIEIYKVFGIKE